MTNFNPRAPCGARHELDGYTDYFQPKFQSACPLRGTTFSVF